MAGNQESQSRGSNGWLWPTLLDISLHIHLAPGSVKDAYARQQAVVAEVALSPIFLVLGMIVAHSALRAFFFVFPFCCVPLLTSRLALRAVPCWRDAWKAYACACFCMCKFLHVCVLPRLHVQWRVWLESN